jgi:acetoin utilization deacetylase AcuC-like enzyme
MKLVVASHPSSHEHDTGPHHPECPARVDAVMAGLESSGVELVRMEAPAVDRADLVRAHLPEYVDTIEAFCKTGGGHLDVDTVVVRASWEAALHSAGAATMLVDELEARSDVSGFAVTRPPGHHAVRGRAMGFCLFNNVAVSALRLRSRGRKVAVVDWDVHHGNGSQDILGDDPGIVYLSIHQDPLYPHEGFVDDLDKMAPGTNVNVPLPPETGGDIYRAAFDEVVVPVLDRFEPDWILVSAGYDAHHADPLADMSLTASDYGAMAERLTKVQAPNRIVTVLEGGYDLDALRDGAAATARGLSGQTAEEDWRESPPSSRRALDKVVASVRRHWDI